MDAGDRKVMLYIQITCIYIHIYLHMLVYQSDDGVDQLSDFSISMKNKINIYVTS